MINLRFHKTFIKAFTSTKTEIQLITVLEKNNSIGDKYLKNKTLETL